MFEYFISGAVVTESERNSRIADYEQCESITHCSGLITTLV